MGVHMDEAEMANLEPQLQKIFKKQLGFFDDDVLSSTIKLINKGAKREELEQSLAAKLDMKKATKLTNEVWSFIEEYNLLKSEADSSLLGKRSRPMTEGEYDYVEASKRKKYGEGGDRYDKAERYDKEQLERLQRPPEKKEPVEVLPSGGDNKIVAPSAEQIQQMLKNTQKMIEERKKKLTVANATLEASAKAAKLAALQASIAAKLSMVDGIPKGEQQQQSKPMPLIIDASGKTVDASGQEIQLTTHVPTLKANLRAQEKKTEFVKPLKTEPKPVVEEARFLDPRIGQRSAARNKRQLAFHEAGKFQAEAQRIRMKVQLERLQSEISSIARKTGISSATQLAKLVPKGQKADKVPDIEWWDQLVLGAHDYENWQIREGAITNLIEHPIQLQPLESNKPVHIPMFLTKKEMKKLRRQNRREAWKEKQDKIRLGLIPPDEPKVKMSNLMRVLGNEQILDPTKVEAHVRAQMAKRKADHEAANAERKLTPAQKKEKTVRKLKEDCTAGVSVAVFRVKNLMNPGKKWKLEKNAQQLYMTGTVVLYQDVNIVVVEGGPKQQKKFKQLMLNRIKWDEDTYTDREGGEHNNCCDLVWEGQTKQRNFGEIKFKLCPTEGLAREHFRQAGVEHYWDQAYSTAVLASSGDL